MGEGVGIEQADTRSVNSFLAAEFARGASAHSVNVVYSALHAYFNWVARQRTYGRPPSPMDDGYEKLVERPTLPIREPKRVQHDEVQKLLDSIRGTRWVDLRDRSIISLMFATGLRRGEVARLRVPDIDQVQNRLKAHGKGNRERLIPINEYAALALFSYLNSRPDVADETLYLGSRGSQYLPREPLTGNGILQMLRRRCDVAGIRYLNPHSFRHGAAMFMLNYGGDLSLVQKVLGHSSPTVTEKFYAQWLIDGLHCAYDRIWANAPQLE